MDETEGVVQADASPGRHRLSTPWPLATGITVLAAVLAVVLLGVIRPAHADQVKRGVRAFSADEQAAMAAASTEAVNLLSYRRAHFDQDFARALAGTTGSLKSDLTKEKATTLKTMQADKIDLTASLNDVALEPPPGTSAKSYNVLVVVTGSTVNNSGQSSPAKVERIEMAMAKSGSKWLASDVQVTDGA